MTKQDLEFVVANKVTHVINAAARQIPNHWENIKVLYLSFLWMDAEGQVSCFYSSDNIRPARREFAADFQLH